MTDFQRQTKEAFLKEYEKYKETEHLTIVLYIHMPDDNIEIITNPSGHNKVDYISKTYDENLTHKNCNDIYIVCYEFIPRNHLEFDFGTALDMMKFGNKLSRASWQGNKYIWQKKEGEILINVSNGAVAPWGICQSDILADDWYIFNGEK